MKNMIGSFFAYFDDRRIYFCDGHDYIATDLAYFCRTCTFFDGFALCSAGLGPPGPADAEELAEQPSTVQPISAWRTFRGCPPGARAPGPRGPWDTPAAAFLEIQKGRLEVQILFFRQFIAKTYFLFEMF